MTPWLTPGEALALHLALLADSLALLRRAARGARAVPYVAFSRPWEPRSGGDEAGIARAAAGMARLPQRGAGLGRRMRNTCRDLLAIGHAGVVILGCDSPTLPAERLRRACETLGRGADAVIGPAEDGGYYLIGVRRAIPGLFDAVPWGTPGVRRATMEVLRRRRARAVTLPRWYDIDLPRDLARLHRDAARRDAAPAPRTAAFARALARAGRLGGAGRE